jgi:hypothetical protein
MIKFCKFSETNLKFKKSDNIYFKHLLFFLSNNFILIIALFIINIFRVALIIKKKSKYLIFFSF